MAKQITLVVLLLFFVIAVDDNNDVVAVFLTLNLWAHQAQIVNITVVNGIANISGTISTSWRGPISGPGIPPINTTGWGASYGGSGGRTTCTNGVPFSNTQAQVCARRLPAGK